MRLLFLLLIVNIALASSSAKFTNFIFFGDSLVDVGNFPASAEFLSHPGNSVKELSADDYIATFYIPISSPVNTDGKHLKIGKYIKKYSVNFSWPNVIPKSAQQLQPPIAGLPRQSKSLLWPEFLLANMQAQHVVSSKDLIPRIALGLGYKNKLNIHDSVDYAWISALTGKGCATSEFNDFTGKCDYKSTLKTVKKYIAVRTDSLKQKVRIPGLIAQVNWFKKDLQAKTVSISKNTAIFLLAGGNDMSKSFSYLTGGSAGKKWTGVENLVAGTAHNVYLAMQKLATVPGHKVQHIYLLTLFNPRWSPRVMHWSKSLQNLATVFVDLYNSGLRLAAWRINRNYPWAHVTVVPLRDWFDNWAEHKGPFAAAFPKDKLGVACQTSNIQYNQAVTPKSNCMNYMFWNAVHPALPSEQLIAYKMGLILQQ